tara:strand:+ start:875 stop:1030 length:156 start_codon:yes stop_codon:yes gene_type:complete
MEHARKLNGKEDITHQRSVERQLSIFEYKEQAINEFLKEENLNQDHDHSIT